ncbi:YbaB/EbfC family nucleoid-associated protein [Micromonospora sp. KC213]|uniref:YbaB/EbfC family nucleoid-associated protein n=1 Tax=Micromonospora sp. KC213 TaxID=2530378 RepID=UPI0010439C24|nr:YbaB/EbfC family nucleoid-associated protein [Micromonospora sp. KC213]TDC41302.1 YbaB/EbfC family DNA-binding protein [Micromonospora sp. KC213]
MTDPLSGLEALAGRLADVERRFAGVQAELDELAGTGVDETGLVSVTVDAAGELTDLTFQPTALRYGTAELTAMVLQAYRRARSAAGERLAERTDGLTAQLGTGLTELFGRPGDFSALGRLDEAAARLDSLDARLPRPPA